MQMIMPDKRATPDHAKLQDRRLVFASIYQNEQIGQAMIARLTNSPLSGNDR
jgi:hypothetical protein